MLKTIKVPTDIPKELWMDKFRTLSDTNKSHAKYWFWDNFDMERQSLWIGKFNKMNRLPSSNLQIVNFLKKLVKDLDQNPAIKSKVYVKLYFSRNTTTHEPDINCLLICNTPKLPEEFSDTLINVVFEKYQLTKAIIERDDNFKTLIDHYINWNNFYNHYDLMGELHY
jgi:hypothetical protein